MRAALWFIGLFGVAVAFALLAGGNQSTVSIFWSPYRIDLSFNLTLLLLAVLFAVLYGAMRAISAMLELPHQARRWRMVKKERAMHAAALDAVVQMLTGRFLRSVKSAQKAIDLQKSLQAQLHEDDQEIDHAQQLAVLSHLVAAESAHALSDQTLRQKHFQAALALGKVHLHSSVQDVVEATLLRAARWSLRERQPQQSLQWLGQLPQGTARRTLALRLRLKAARLDQQNSLALETARLLSKHGAFGQSAGSSLLRELCMTLLQQAQDASQLQRVWAGLDRQEQTLIDVALFAVRRLHQLQGSPEQVMAWLMPLWNRLLKHSNDFNPAQRRRLIHLLSETLGQAPKEMEWLNSIEQARLAYPRWPELQYLAGMICWQHALWGKAQQMLEAALQHLDDGQMQRQALVTLALLAEQRNDNTRAQQLWRRAAEVIL